jgi:hypothetical protein
MSRLEILKKLERRRKRGHEIQKSMVSRIQYMGDLRRAMERETMRAEQSRLRGLLAQGPSNPQLLRAHLEDLTRQLRQ